MSGKLPAPGPDRVDESVGLHRCAGARDNVVGVRGSVSGSEKRQATLQICVSGDLSKSQPDLCIILRGSGTRISELEQAHYIALPGITALWQPKVLLFVAVYGFKLLYIIL